MLTIIVVLLILGLIGGGWTYRETLAPEYNVVGLLVLLLLILALARII